MKITEIQVTLTSEKIQERDGVLAFVRLVFESSLAIRDIKVMERDSFIYLGMPSRKVTEPCLNCGRKAAVTDVYCHYCGKRRTPTPKEDKKIYVDTAYPINQEFRLYLEEQVMNSYNTMVPKDKQLKLRGQYANPSG
jgi:DNA-binding cell septation regulator SpoVG